MLWLILIAVGGTIALVGSAGLDKIRALHSGPPIWVLVFYACTILAMVCVFGARYAVQNSSDARDRTIRTETAERFAAVDEELRRIGSSVERIELSGGRVLLQTNSVGQIGQLETERADIRILDSRGAQQAAIVVHLFPNSAYWQFDSASSFETQTGSSLDFFPNLTSASTTGAFSKFDLLVGVGVVSNSLNASSGLSRARAAMLCGALFSQVNSTQQRALGLALGVYEGPAQDSLAQPQRLQRSVIVLGVSKLMPSITDRALVEEVLRQVALPGVDLRLYSELREDRRPQWVETRECTHV